MPLDTLIVADSPYVSVAFGLAGSLIGGFIAGTVSLVVARQAREAAEQSWIRDSRRDIYDRFLTSAQRLLIACEASHGSGEGLGAPDADEAGDALEQAHVDFFEVYGVVQTVAQGPVVDAARVYAYRLLELSGAGRRRLALEQARGSIRHPERLRFERVAQLVRLARHETIDAMRVELGLIGSARPPSDFNPFRGTDLEHAYTARPAER